MDYKKLTTVYFDLWKAEAAENEKLQQEVIDLQEEKLALKQLIIDLREEQYENSMEKRGSGNSETQKEENK